MPTALASTVVAALLAAAAPPGGNFSGTVQLPKTMEGKKALRRLVFGRLIRMPLELKPGLMAVPRLNPLPPDAPDRNHKIIFCAATLPGLSPDSRCIPEST